MIGQSGYINYALSNVSRNFMKYAFSISKAGKIAFREILKEALEKLDMCNSLSIEDTLLQSRKSEDTLIGLNDIRQLINIKVQDKNAAIMIKELRDALETGDVITEDDISLVVNVPPVTHKIIQDDLIIKKVIFDTRRSTIKHDRTDEQLVTYAGIQVIKPNLTDDTLNSDQPQREGLQVTTGPIVNDSEVKNVVDRLEIMSTGNGFKVVSCEVLPLSGKYVLITTDTSDISSNTKKTMIDPGFSTTGIERAGFFGIKIDGQGWHNNHVGQPLDLSRTRGKEMQQIGSIGLQTRIYWHNSAGKETGMSMEEAVKILTACPAFYDYDKQTVFYNQPVSEQHKKDVYNNKTTQPSLEVVHRIMIDNYYDDKYKQTYQDQIAMHNQKTMVWKTSNKTAFTNWNQSKHPNGEKILSRQRVVSDVTAKNYNSIDNAYKMMDCLGPNVQLCLTPQFSEREAYKFDREYSGKDIKVKVVPNLMTGNVPFCLLSHDLLRDLGMIYLKSVIIPTTPINQLYHSLNSGKYCPEAKLCEQLIIRKYKNSEQIMTAILDENTLLIEYLRIAVFCYQYHGMIVCDSNLEIMKAMADILINVNLDHVPPVIKEANECGLLSICRDITKFVNNVTEELFSQVNSVCQQYGGDTQNKNDLFLAGQKINWITDPFTPTTLPRGCMGSNMMAAAFYDMLHKNRKATAYSVAVDLENVRNPLVSNLYDDDIEPDTLVYRWVKTDNVEEVFQNITYKNMIEYKFFDALHNAFTAHRSVGVKTYFLNTTDAERLESEKSSSNSTCAFVHEMTKKKDDRKPVHRVDAGIQLIETLACDSIQFSNDKYTTRNACCIDAVCMTNGQPIHVKGPNLDEILCQLDKPTDTKITFTPLPINRDSCFWHHNNEGIDAECAVRNSALPVSTASRLQPDIAAYADGTATLRREAVHNSESAHKKYNPVDLLHTVIPLKAYVTPEGDINMVEQVGHVGRFAFLVNISDKIKTENIMICKPKSVVIREHPMITTEENINGTDNVNLTANYSMSHLHAGTGVVNVPSVTFTNFATDGGANVSGTYIMSENGSGTHHLPITTKQTYKTIMTKTQGSWVHRKLLQRSENRGNKSVFRKRYTTFKANAGECGVGEQSDVQLLPIPTCFDIRSICNRVGVNVRNPGKDSVFLNFANDVTDNEWTTCSREGSNNPWTTTPMSTGVVLTKLVSQTGSHPAFLPPSIWIHQNPVAKILVNSDPISDLKYIDSAINNNIKQNNGNNSSDLVSHATELSFDALTRNSKRLLRMSDICGSSMVLAHFTNHSLLEQNKENLRNGSEAYIREGHHSFLGDYANIFSPMQKIY